jgi:parallel beta-helix repeat protein
MHGFGVLRRGALLGVGACLVAVGLAIPTAADATVTSLKTCERIVSPGEYRLDANIATNHGCFFLDASGVTLDLNGHTITDTKFPVDTGTVGIMAFKGGNKILGPGTLAGFDFGISLVNQGHDSVHGVAAIANSIGIGVNSKDNSVRDNVTVHNLVVGIDLYVSATGNTIESNFAQANRLDLRDNIPGCVGNDWSGNDFVTANESCIH